MIGEQIHRIDHIDTNFKKQESTMHALIIGATGATGLSLLTQLLADHRFTQVSIFVRRPVAITHDKLTVHVIDFEHLDDYQDLISGDVLFSCLGTTLKDAGSQDAQWQIDYTYQYEFAKLAKHGGIQHLILVSSAFADATARGFYVRMKGQLEQDVMALGFESLSIFRPPSLIRPDTDRLGEKVSLPVIQALNTIGLLKTLRPMPVDTLATALRLTAKQPPVGVQIFEAKDIWQIAK